MALKLHNARYCEYVMTQGDMEDYFRLVGDLEAMQRIAAKRPASANALKAAIRAKVRQIAAMEARYA